MDPTTVLAAAIAGLSGVTAGYIGSRQQTRTLGRQLQEERERQERQFREERERQEQERRLTLRDGRVAAYTALLDVERQLRRLLASRRAFSEAEYGKWWADFEDRNHLVQLTGTEPVRGLAERLHELYGEVDGDRLIFGGSHLDEALIHAFSRHEPEIESAREQLTNVMRSDVAEQESLVNVNLTTYKKRPRKRNAADRQEVAVVSTTDMIPADKLRAVVDAVQIQVDRHFGPAWGISATIRHYERLDDVPQTAWPITVAQDISAPGTASFHSDHDGRPYAMVAAMDDWPVYLSHDCLEMLASPFNTEIRWVPSPKPGQGRAALLVQVCDPCRTYTYVVNGITVADFILPSYLDPGQPVSRHYDYMGKIKKPLELVQDCYLTWYDLDTRHLWQVYQHATGPEYKDLGEFDGVNAATAAVKTSSTIGFYGAA